MFRFIKLLLPKSKEEWFHIMIAALGIVMISVSAFCDVDMNNNAKTRGLALLGDLGIGIFPTGIIGLLLERMQNREKGEQKHRRRIAILHSLDISIHAYFNTICNLALVENASFNGDKVFDIFQAIKDETIIVEYSDDEVKALRRLVAKIKESFEFPDPTYIAADIFSENEENHFLLLIGKGEELLKSMEIEGCKSSQRYTFLSYLKVACEEISEFNKFLDMVSDGNNISIPV